MKRVFYIILVLALGYLVWPYASIAQLGKAVRDGDVETLENRVAWNDVRSGLKTDLAEMVDREVKEEASSSGNALANALANLVSPTVSETLVSGVVDTAVTPQNVAELSKRAPKADEATAQERQEEMLKDPLKHIQWAFFSGLTSFEARVRPDRGEPATQFNFELQGLNWKLVRVIPPENFSLPAG